MSKIPIRQFSPPHKPAVAERFSIRKLSDVLGGKKLVHDLHRHDYFFILAVEKGKGHHQIDFIDYKVKDFTVFILRPGQVHQLELEVGTTGFIVEFDHHFYRTETKPAGLHLSRAFNTQYCPLERTRFARLKEILTSIYEEYTDKNESYAGVIKASLDIFFIEFLRQRQHTQKNIPKANSYALERFEEFSSLVQGHVAEFKQVSDYANRMSLSVYQLNAITKTIAGKPASSVINDHIIMEARRYLLATSNQVKEIADALGYEDISYFIRFFKRHTGLSPENYRKRFQ